MTKICKRAMLAHMNMIGARTLLVALVCFASFDLLVNADRRIGF